MKLAILLIVVSFSFSHDCAENCQCAATTCTCSNPLTNEESSCFHSRHLQVKSASCDQDGNCSFDFERLALIPIIFNMSGKVLLTGNESDYDFSKLHCADGFNECEFSCCYQGKCLGRLDACSSKFDESIFANILLYMYFLLIVIAYLVILIYYTFKFEQELQKNYYSEKSLEIQDEQEEKEEHNSDYNPFEEGKNKAIVSEVARKRIFEEINEDRDGEVIAV